MRSLGELFLMSGVSVEDCRAEIVELYPPPRVTTEISGKKGVGLVPKMLCILKMA